MTAEISCGVLVAANDCGADCGADKRVALGMVVDVEAAVMVYALAPRGRGYFEFMARPSYGSASITPLSAANGDPGRDHAAPIGRCDGRRAKTASAKSRTSHSITS